jgi:histidine triad (HIT) family protein
MTLLGEDLMDDCLFCKIAAGKIPAQVVYEDERILAFDDIRPQAPIHTLIIPKAHYASLNEFPEGEASLLGHVLFKAREIARAKGIGETGYRVVLNTARDAGQEVFHIHFHVLGGRRLTWPPG